MFILRLVNFRDRIQEIMSTSLMLVTALNPKIGYDNASKVENHRVLLVYREYAVMGLIAGKVGKRSTECEIYRIHLRVARYKSIGITP